LKELIELGLFTRKDKTLVSSRVIAENFDKEHSEVLKSIDGESRKEKHINGLVDRINNSGVNTRQYFIPSNYKDSSGKTNKEYLLTRDGFSLLVMGFTGQKALEWKLKYIDAFNKMEAFIREKQSSEWLQTRKSGKLVRRNETDSLAQLLIYAINQGSKTYEKNPELLYSTYAKLVNGAVGIKKGQREYATRKVLDTIAFIEDMILNTVREEMKSQTEYHDIYVICKERTNQIIKYAYLPNQKLIA
jgi:Rha family phage regulatory protein